MKHFTRALAATLALIFFPAPPARASARQILVLNAGNSAIFYLRIGNASTARWSADLLGYAGVIDVGRGEDVAMDVDAPTCTYDLQATYGDGTTQVAPSIDLCTTDRVSFYESLPGR